MKQFSIFILFLSLTAIAQKKEGPAHLIIENRFDTLKKKNFSKEITENKFAAVKKKKIPINIIKALGCDSYSQVGTKRTQTGCTSGKQIVMNWVVTDNKGTYILSVSTCGFVSSTSCLIISGNENYTSGLKGEFNSFDEFKKTYFMTYGIKKK